MFEFFTLLFDTSDFPARWHCGRWTAFLGWLHILSDIATFGAYFTIPVALIYLARKRTDFPFTGLFWLFAGFILSCGTVHLIEATIFWYPVYRVSGLVKFITAVLSWGTVVGLLRIFPAAMQFPSLAVTNEKLRLEVAQRKETERELLAAKARYEAMLTGTISIVWTTDSEGNFVVPQTSWERYTGQSWQEHQGTGWTKAIRAEDTAKLLKLWNEARTSLRKYEASGSIWHHESQTYRSFSVEAVPVFAEDGSLVEWVGTVRDIEDEQQALSKLDRAQSELAQQKRELELIYQAAPVGMSLIDREFKFLRINETLAQINGYSRDYHIGRHLNEVMRGLFEQVQPFYQRVFETGQPVLDVEVCGKRAASESERTWLVSYYPIEVANGSSADNPHVTAVGSIVQDITDRKFQEVRLKESERAALAANQSKSEFLANMSHEIRTPMAAILGYADVLLGHLKDPDNRNCVLIIKRNGDYLLELINDILDLSRIEANKLEVDLKKVSLPQLLAGIRSLMHVRASEKQLDFIVKFSTPVPETIQTDPTRLRQVLINLLGNAIKFTEHGTVELSVRFIEQPRPSLNFAVIDTGIGIKEEQLNRLFKPFSQGDASVTREYGGSGLGLAISQRLVDMLGGELTAESQLGKGSKFQILLACDADSDVAMVQPTYDENPTEHEVAINQPRNLNCRVLVVDDRRDVRHISQHFLEKSGASVVTAEDGQKGLDAAIAAKESELPFDLILMDMQMPVLDGLQATAKLRSLGIECPIIALTADAMKGDRERSLNGGCDDYLSKPIEQAMLIEMVYRYTKTITREELRAMRIQRTARLLASLGEMQ